MQYNGHTLCTTFARHENGARYCYVSTEHGLPLEGIGGRRWERLKLIQQQEQGWRVIGTWPVAKHPADVWSR